MRWGRQAEPVLVTDLVEIREAIEALFPQGES
jgi:hypothetical protein